jgi:hypothetical protein
MTFDYRWSNRVVGECISKSVTLAKITVRRSTRIIASAMTTDKRIVLCEFLYELIGNNLAVEYRFSMLNQLKNAAESRGQESVNYETIITCSDNARRASQTVGNHIADEMKRRITLPSPHWEDL